MEKNTYTRQILITRKRDIVGKGIKRNTESVCLMKKSLTQ